MGRPIVATRVGGVADLLIDGDNGLLVEPRNPAQLAEAIGKFADNPALCRSMGHRNWVRAKSLTAEALAAQMCRFIAQSTRR